MSHKGFSRRYTREATLKFIFRYDFYDILDMKSEVDRFFEQIDVELEKLDKEYFDTVTKGIFENKINIDKLISKNLRGWSIKRISKIDLSIIRLATYEIKKIEDIPLNIAINEAVELAKKYSSEKSPAFVNGVLSKIPKDVLDG